MSYFELVILAKCLYPIYVTGKCSLLEIFVQFWGLHVYLCFYFSAHQLPSWVFVICAVGLFLYQTLDALDGKQWWRTGREESPLEELTDHAADCISLVFLVLQISVALQLGNTPAWLFFFCFSGVFLFYCFHWQVYVTGIVRFGM